MNSVQSRPPMPKAARVVPKNSSQATTNVPRSSTPTISVAPISVAPISAHTATVEMPKPPENVNPASSGSLVARRPLPATVAVTMPVTAAPVSQVATPKAPRRNWLGYVTPVWNGGKAAVQAFAITFSLLALLVLIALQADGDSASWALALTGATRFWLLAHGAGATFGELQLSIVPLGLTAVCVAMIWLLARRVKPSLASGIGGVVAYAAIGVIVTRVSGVALSVTLRAALGAVIVGLAGFTWALATHLPQVTRLWAKVPLPAIIGLRAAGVALLSTVAAAAALTAGWAVLGHSSTRAVAQTLQPGVVGAIVMGLGQLFVLPNLLAWVMSWLTGPGFALGVGTEFSPAAWQGGPLPALPIMAAVPPNTWAGPYWLWVPLIVLLAGAIAGWFLWNQVEALPREPGTQTTWGTRCIALGAGAGATLAAMFGLQLLARGSLGSGRLSQVGATPWLVALIFTAEVLAGMVVVVLGKWLGSRPMRVKGAIR